MDSQEFISTEEFELWQQTTREKIFNDNNYLPTIKTVTAAFSDEDGNALNTEWKLFFGKQPYIYEILTTEYTHALAEYLRNRSTDFKINLGRKMNILDIGAGNGRLGTLLNKFAGDAYKIQSVDYYATNPIVEKLDYQEALTKYNPDLVICSWMPPDEDWSQSIRATPSVREYLLIGETDDGVCGEPWSTWGFISWDKPTPTSAPYILDGFTRTELDSLSELQICRTDLPGRYEQSHTVSFRRLT